METSGNCGAEERAFPVRYLGKVHAASRRFRARRVRMEAATLGIRSACRTAEFLAAELEFAIARPLGAGGLAHDFSSASDTGCSCGFLRAGQLHGGAMDSKRALCRPQGQFAVRLVSRKRNRNLGRLRSCARTTCSAKPRRERPWWNCRWPAGNGFEDFSRPH